MAPSAKQFSLFLILTLLFSLHTHARDNQFFNKIPTNTKNVVPETKQPLNNQPQEPNFMPENENNYGLYGHDSAKLRPSATTSAATNKNYSPVAYVSEPDDINEITTFADDDNKEEDSIYKNKRSNKYYYNGGGSFNRQPQGLRVTRFSGGAAYNRGGFLPQGMSDTRFLENGKYFYDVNREKYSNNHPYERLRANRERNEYNNKNLYGNSDYAYENSVGGYQNQEEFQDEENNLP